jgi:hypothetical protein
LERGDLIAAIEHALDEGLEVLNMGATGIYSHA